MSRCFLMATIGRSTFRECSPRIVVEIPIVRTIDNGLHVAGIVVIEDVEYGDTGAHFEVALTGVNCERPGYLKIGGRETWVTVTVTLCTRGIHPVPIRIPVCIPHRHPSPSRSRISPQAINLLGASKDKRPWASG